MIRWSFEMILLKELGTPGKKRWSISNREMWLDEQLCKKKLDQLDETITRITLCVSFTNLNWWQATDFAYYLFSLKKDWREILLNLGRSSMNQLSDLGRTNELMWEHIRRNLEQTAVRTWNMRRKRTNH